MTTYTPRGVFREENDQQLPKVILLEVSLSNVELCGGCRLEGDANGTLFSVIDHRAPFRLHRSLRRESNLSQRFGGQARGSDRAAADGSPHDAAVGTGVQRRKRIESERHSHSRRFKVHRRHRGGVLSGVLEDARLRHMGVLHRRL